MKKIIVIAFVISAFFLIVMSCNRNSNPASPAATSTPTAASTATPMFGFGQGMSRPQCSCTVVSGRTDLVAPQTVDTANWGAPLKVSPPVNTDCPEDAIEISRDGQTLYFMWSQDLIENLTVAQQLQGTTGTYYARRLAAGGPGEFEYPKFFELRKGASSGANDGELSFSPAGDKVYFHSLRAENTGWLQPTPVNDVLDIYVSTVSGNEPGPGVNLGNTINSVYIDGEHCISPDGNTLYFASNRPGGLGGADIYYSQVSGTSWTTPVNIGSPVNSSAEDKMPAFAANDPNTMFFVSDRNGIGVAIYRSTYSGGIWGAPVLVIQGQVGEPSLTGDGSILYFVHVLTDNTPLHPVFGADIYYVLKQ